MSDLVGNHIVGFSTRWLIFQPYLTTIAVLVYILPTVVIATCYIGICLIIWKTWKSGLSCPKLIVTEGKEHNIKSGMVVKENDRLRKL